MSEKKVIYQANVISLPTLKMILGEVPTQNHGRDCRHLAGSEIKQPGIELETVVTKLITHLKKNNK